MIGLVFLGICAFCALICYCSLVVGKRADEAKGGKYDVDPDHN